jgi:hypothetical protein
LCFPDHNIRAWIDTFVQWIRRALL